MQTDYFYTTEQDPAWSFNSDPWSTREVFNTAVVDAIAKGPIEASDLEVGQALTQLVHDELRAYGTDSTNRLQDAEMASALRALIILLRRLGIVFKTPFRDFSSFRDYWSGEGMSGPGGWGARRSYLNQLFHPVWERLGELDILGASSTSARGVDGQLRNVIFASSGPKPEIVLRDAVNNVVDIVKHAEHCLIYDRLLPESGLTWGGLTSWWGSLNGEPVDAPPTAEHAKNLYRRLYLSLGQNKCEQLVFRTYCERYGTAAGFDTPALLPQVYLHFDPFTATERNSLGKPARLSRERMDFLLLLPNRVRVVIEVDGKQHYADGNTAAPKRYAEMVAEDRTLRLRGYEVFRFGGFELMQDNAHTTVRTFFDSLLATHEAA